MRSFLKFGKGNAKLGKRVYHVSLPSGHTCPFAHNCLSKADKVTGKLTDGKATEFRCFSATQENIYTNVRTNRWGNFTNLRLLTTEQMVSLIELSLPTKAEIVRIHVGGDFFSQKYFDAWVTVAQRNPSVLFYAYTKSLPYWVARLTEIPANFVLTASRGGRRDDLIDTHNLREARVIYEIEETALSPYRAYGMEIDHDDSHAMRADGRSFALLIHGQQPKGSVAGKFMRALQGLGSYPLKKNAKRGKLSRKEG